jgi:hypothetical protein
VIKHIRITAYFSIETLQSRRAWNDMFQVLKEKNCKPSLSLSIKLSFLTEGEIKTSQDKQKLKQFMTTKPEQQKVIKVIYTQKRKENVTLKIWKNKSH